jgi:hypothetical protein
MAVERQRLGASGVTMRSVRVGLSGNVRSTIRRRTVRASAFFITPAAAPTTANSFTACRGPR